MKALTHRILKMNDVEPFFLKKRKRKGILQKQNLEEVRVFEPIWRPFRFIHFSATLIEKERPIKAVSLIDETIAQIAKKDESQFLLWRPRYYEIEATDLPEVEPINAIDELDNQKTQKFFDDFVSQRTRYQNEIYDIERDLREIQRDPRSAASFLIPRNPMTTRKEEKLVVESKSKRSFIIASSLVTNCPRNYWIDNCSLGERVYIQTFMANYEDIETRENRYLFIENTSKNTLSKSLQFGKILTRLCESDPDYLDKMKNTFDSF
ncbi:MAG: hypothetical protein ACW99V_03320 [Candidatus Thorarchaeota archaeon]